MRPPKPRADAPPRVAPRLTGKVLAASRRELLAGPREPLHPVGTVTDCPTCGQKTMVTTNDLEETVPTPFGVRIVTRLPGARCQMCGHRLLDAAGLALLEEHRAPEIVADYETSVTTVGPMLATYLKGDLRRVFGLKGKEKLRWKVLDRDHAWIEIDRARV